MAGEVVDKDAEALELAPTDQTQEVVVEKSSSQTAPSKPGVDFNLALRAAIQLTFKNGNYIPAVMGCTVTYLCMCLLGLLAAPAFYGLLQFYKNAWADENKKGNTEDLWVGFKPTRNHLMVHGLVITLTCLCYYPMIYFLGGCVVVSMHRLSFWYLAEEYENEESPKDFGTILADSRSVCKDQSALISWIIVDIELYIMMAMITILAGPFSWLLFILVAGPLGLASSFHLYQQALDLGLKPVPSMSSADGPILTQV